MCWSAPIPSSSMTPDLGVHKEGVGGRLGVRATLASPQCPKQAPCPLPPTRHVDTHTLPWEPDGSRTFRRIWAQPGRQLSRAATGADTIPRPSRVRISGCSCPHCNPRRLGSALPNPQKGGEGCSGRESQLSLILRQQPCWSAV